MKKWPFSFFRPNPSPVDDNPNDAAAAAVREVRREVLKTLDRLLARCSRLSVREGRLLGFTKAVIEVSSIAAARDDSIGSSSSSSPSSPSSSSPSSSPSPQHHSERMLILREAVAAIESDFNLHLRVLRDLESIRKELQDPGLDMRRLIRVTEKLGDMVQDIIAAEKRSTYRVKALKENADVLDTPPDKRGPEEDPLR